MNSLRAHAASSFLRLVCGEASTKNVAVVFRWNDMWSRLYTNLLWPSRHGVPQHWPIVLEVLWLVLVSGISRGHCDDNLVVNWLPGAAPSLTWGQTLEQILEPYPSFVTQAQTQISKIKYVKLNRP